MKNILQRNWEFATKSDFLIPISLQPNVVDLIDLKKLEFEISKICDIELQG